MPVELLNQRPVEQGFHIILIYLNDITQGLFMNLLLFSVWCITCFSIYYGQKKLRGKGDISMAVATAGFITAITATLFIMIPGLINGWVYGICLSVAGLGVLFFLSTKNE